MNATRSALAVTLLLCGCHYRMPTDWLSSEVQPLWTESDLPELPPDAENGWVLFGQGIWEIRHQSPPAHLMELVHRSYNHEYPEESAARSPEISWMEALELREEIEAFLDAEDNRAAVGLLSKALSRPRFVDNEAIVPQISRGEAQRREIAAVRGDVLDRCEGLGLLAALPRNRLRRSASPSPHPFPAREGGSGGREMRGRPSGSALSAVEQFSSS